MFQCHEAERRLLPSPAGAVLAADSPPTAVTAVLAVCLLGAARVDQISAAL